MLTIEVGRAISNGLCKQCETPLQRTSLTLSFEQWQCRQYI